MAPRSQPYRVSWPLNALQATNIDNMFQILFEDIRNGAVTSGGSSVTYPITADLGGTGLSAFTIGDLLYATSATTLGRLAVGASGKYLTSDGSAPQWSTLSASLTTQVTGVLPVANGGTNLSSYTTGDLPYASGATTISKLAIGANGKYLQSNGTSPTWVTLTAATLPIVLTTDVSGVLPVANGGTAVGTFTANGVLYGNAATSVLVTAQGAANTILTANAGAPSFSATPTIGTSVTTPLLIGGTAVGSSLALKSTTGVGTTDFIKFLVGNNGATEAMRIIDSGNVGIGIAAPTKPLHVLGASKLDGTITVGGTTFGVLEPGGTFLYIQETGGVSLILRDKSFTSHPIVLNQVSDGTQAGTNLSFVDNSFNYLMTIVETGQVGLINNVPTAYFHLPPGDSAPTFAPLKFTSGTNLTSPEAGAVEFNGTNLFFTRAAARENVLVAIDNVAAPSTSVGVAIVNYFGSSATNFLGTPNRWISVNILGSTYKIPLYT